MTKLIHTAKKLFKPLFKASSTDSFLWYANEPLPQLKEPLIKLSAPEIKQKFNFDYVDNIFIPNETPIENLCETIQSDTLIHVELIKTKLRAKQTITEPERAKLQELHHYKLLADKISERLKNPLSDKFAVCKINDRVGYGLFATDNISEGTVLGLYGGIHKSLSSMSSDERAYCDPSDTTALENGNAMRFIQHMPTDVDNIITQIDSITTLPELAKMASLCAVLILENTPLSAKQFKEQKEVLKTKMQKALQEADRLSKEEKQSNANIETASTLFMGFTYSNIPVSMVITTRPINRGQQLGIDYSLKYWKSRKIRPERFDKTGNISTQQHQQHIKVLGKTHCALFHNQQSNPFSNYNPNKTLMLKP